MLSKRQTQQAVQSSFLDPVTWYVYDTDPLSWPLPFPLLLSSRFVLLYIDFLSRLLNSCLGTDKSRGFPALPRRRMRMLYGSHCGGSLLDPRDDAGEQF